MSKCALIIPQALTFYQFWCVLYSKIDFPTFILLGLWNTNNFTKYPQNSKLWKRVFSNFVTRPQLYKGRKSALFSAGPQLQNLSLQTGLR